ncbi:MAG: sulfatase-like hydrolase/transferase [Proteobacteria bacterium]|nr:sulfatase-like hydrolase/transferase [Pseudomonadota bacterium]
MAHSGRATSGPAEPASAGPASVEPAFSNSLAPALGAALATGAILALADVAMALVRGGSGGLELVMITGGLYAVPALAVGLLGGIVAGGFRATHGRGALSRLIRRMVDDRAFDRAVTGGLLAAVLVTLLFVLAAATAAMVLVAEVQRKQAGALLMGLSLACALPLIAAMGWPIYRITRVVAGLVPRIGPIPRSGVAAVGSLVGVFAIAVYFVFTRLEWRALNLDAMAFLGSYPALCLVWLVLWYRVLYRVRKAIGAGVVALVAGSLGAVALPLYTLGVQPSEQTVLSLTEHSMGARILVGAGRSLIDRDSDGFSAFLGGPDCDDRDPAVHPDAREIADNGVDDNCLGGDRKSDANVEARPSTAQHTRHAPDRAVGRAAGVNRKGGATPSSRTGRADNALIIMVDTVRADRLGVAGYRRDGKSLTPRLDDLAENAAYFTRVYAQAPNTPRSVPSTFASRFPSQLAVASSFVNYPKLLDQHVSVFEVLRDAGIHTVGYASHFYFREERNARQGFELFDNEGALDIKGSNKDTAAPRIVPKVEAKLAELAKHGRRFAVFVHLFEPHSTYMAHAEYPITERGIAGLVQKYDYEIAYVDRWIGRILAAVERHGLADRTAVFVYSDHGEAFGVHRVAGKQMFFHGQTLYDELLRVPLIISIPGSKPGVYDDTVMLIDLAPTLCDALGVAQPDRFVGRSLLPRITGQPLANRPAYGELLPAPSWKHSAKMVVSREGRYKLYHRISESRYELYDLKSDPEERVDLSAKRPDVVKQLKQELLRWIEVDLP